MSVTQLPIMAPFLIPLALLVSTLPLLAEWKDLFNGKDLTGWSGDPRLWRVEDGVLIGETNNADKKIAANSFLIWQGGEPADFELEYKAKVVGNNSGVQYRSKVANAATWSVGGYQMDLHPNAPYLGMLYEERGRGIACERGKRVKLNEKPKEVGKLEVPAVDLSVWNSYRIVAKGNLVQHFVNGQLAAEIEDIHPEKRSLKGVLALQLHAGPAMKTEFKDIRIQETPSAEPPKAGADKGAKRPQALARSVKPAWIWKSKQPGPTEKVFFCRDFEVPATIRAASVTLSCDNRHHLSINGKDIGMGGEWSHPPTYDIGAHLKPGAANRIAIAGVNEGGAAGLAVRILLTLKNGSTQQIVSDASWQCSNEAEEGWQTSGSSTALWPQAVVIAKMGDGPWGDVMGPDSSEAGIAEDMTNAYQVAKDFKLERIYRIPSNQGSWVSMTLDGKGKLLCSDQYGKIYRVELAGESSDVTVATPLDIPLKGAHGLLWHEGVLWVCIN
jgi:hypothetical protein